MCNKIILVTGVLLMVFSSSAIFAQGNETQNAVAPIAQPTENPAVPSAENMTVQPESGTEYAYGVVANVSPDQIVLLEYDYDTDEDIEVVYNIDAGTKFENADSLQGIVIDDSVEIYYKEIEGKKIASIIAKEDDGWEETEGMEAGEPAVDQSGEAVESTK